MHSIAVSILLVFFLTAGTGSLVSASEKPKTTEMSGDTFIASLEETYIKFINDNSNKPLVYNNISNRYYHMTFTDNTSETLQLTQILKEDNTWEYETLRCTFDNTSQQQACMRKTNEEDWTTYENDTMIASLSSVMVEPITLTSLVIGDTKPKESVITYHIKPGYGSNIYLNNYRSADGKIRGTLTQEISANSYKLKLKETGQPGQETLIYVNVL